MNEELLCPHATTPFYGLVLYEQDHKPRVTYLDSWVVVLICAPQNA